LDVSYKNYRFHTMFQHWFKSDLFDPNIWVVWKVHEIGKIIPSELPHFQFLYSTVALCDFPIASSENFNKSARKGSQWIGKYSSLVDEWYLKENSNISDREFFLGIFLETDIFHRKKLLWFELWNAAKGRFYMKKFLCD
jgi:hypothetical protein